MARIRSIKPEFWKSEAIARLPHRTRLTFIALWSYVDDSGVGRDVPQLIAGELFALEDDPREALANVREDLARLSEEGRITRYTVEGKPFLHITGWDEHQKIDKPNKARYPFPNDPAAVLTCGSRDPREGVAKPARELREDSEQLHLLEQGNRGTEEQGIPPTAGDASPPPGETEGQRVNRLSKTYADAVPLSNFPAVAGVVRKAVKTGQYDDEQITAALGRLAEDQRSVTTDTLRYELEGRPPLRAVGGQPRPSVRSFTDEDYSSGF